MASSSRIFVKGLPPSLKVEDFRKHFSKQSPITDAKLIPHRRIGYVGFRTSEEAIRAVKYYNRSFIRMSKIGVELARSVDNLQRALKSHGSEHRMNGKKNASRVATGHYSDSDGASDASAPVKKKRRLSVEQDLGDEKLQEYLDIMQPPSKSKAWDNRDVVDVMREQSLHPQPKTQTPLMVDERDDREYEPVTKKAEPSRGAANNVLEVAPMEYVPPPIDGAVSAQTPPNDVNGGDTSQRGLEMPSVATDDDWLRSRTNRLLDLVDEDETLARRTDAASETANGGLDNQDPETSVKQPNVNLQGDNPTGSKDLINETSTFTAVEEPVDSNGRLFLRNLTYAATEDDIRNHFESHGYAGVKEIHLPLDFRSSNGNNKGFAHIQFSDHESAERALQGLDQKSFQGRLLHILHSNPKPEVLDEFTFSSLPLSKQQHIRRKNESSSSFFNWNSMYMSSDAVMSSISERLGVAKAEILDPTSSDAAIKQAHAETHIIQETKSYFKANGVDLDAFKKSARGSTTILIKNFPFGTKADELRSLFDTHGPLKQLLMPPSGTIAIVDFHQADHARFAISSLSYSKFKGSVLFLEKAPKDLFTISESRGQVNGGDFEARQAKPVTAELLDENRPASVNTTTLFVKNLNFATTEDRMREAFKSSDGFVSARVKTKPDPKKKGQVLSMGFGFLEFRSKEQAQVALAAFDGHKLDGHELLIRASHKAIDAAEEKRTEDQAKKMAGRKTKIIIKNLPFEATKKDVRSLFGAYGQLRSVRVPKKFDSSTRGFAFADFITAREAESAMDALKDTHLLGRRLVLQFAAEQEIDPEAEIEQMQKKVGRQADKVALQKLTGTGRRKFNIEGADEHDQLVD